jgi:hypothetical protein
MVCLMAPFMVRRSSLLLKLLGDVLTDCRVDLGRTDDRISIFHPLRSELFLECFSTSALCGR